MEFLEHTDASLALKLTKFPTKTSTKTPTKNPSFKANPTETPTSYPTIIESDMPTISISFTPSAPSIAPHNSPIEPYESLNNKPFLGVSIAGGIIVICSAAIAVYAVYYGIKSRTTKIHDSFDFNTLRGSYVDRLQDLMGDSFDNANEVNV